MENIAKNLHNTKDVCTFAVLTVRQTSLSRRAAVNCSMVIGHFYARYLRILGGCLYVVIVLFFGAKYVGL